MSAGLATPRYRYGRQAGGRERGIAWLLIVALHALVLTGLSMAGVELPVPKLPEAMMVSFISQRPPAVETPKPETPPPPKLEPPRMVATPKPTPSTMEVVAPDQPPEPVEASPPPVEPGPPPPAAEPAVVPPSFSAAHLNNPGPQVPYQSRKLGEQGTVWLRVLVSAEGGAQQVQVDRSSGYARLDQAAVEVVKARWRFVPARRGDEPIAAWVLVPISFERSTR